MSSVTAIIKCFFVVHSYRLLKTHYLSILTIMGNFAGLHRMNWPRRDQLTLRHLCKRVKINVTWGVGYFLIECFTGQWGPVACTRKPFCDRAIQQTFLFLADHCIADRDVRLNDKYSAPKIITLSVGPSLYPSLLFCKAGNIFWETERTPLYKPCCFKSPGKQGLRWANMQTAIASKSFGPSEVPATVHSYGIAIEPTCKPVLNTWKAIDQNLTPSRLLKTAHPWAWLRALQEC